MPKNIVIFSDGTGQAGGLRPDQNLSNIYKLFRACRPGPESPIDPTQQVAFYDAGLGTMNDEGRIPFRPIQLFRKLWSSATGTGISRNIVDCYEAILKHYEPGDRVFLFGFSRGAYTARCVGGVLSLCGIPTCGADGGPLPRYGQSLRRIANEAVREVYEHGSGSNKLERREERIEKARRFRAKYNSNNTDGQANTLPYFIGVFDTVAALGAPGPRRLMMGIILAAFVALMIAIASAVLSLTPWLQFGWTYFALLVIALSVMGAKYLKTHLKTIRNFPNQGDVKRHMAAWRFRFYDNQLNPRVQYARHALAIDETRKDFMRVPWGSPTDWPARPNGLAWLKQVWFAGNHSDVGGSYPEDESRLSDIALSWMVEQVSELPEKLQIDYQRLHLFPNANGMQHCEVQAMIDRYPAWIPKWLKLAWSQEVRRVKNDAPLHPSVLERFRIQPGVLHFASTRPYRPQNLAEHVLLGDFYGPPIRKSWRHTSARSRIALMDIHAGMFLRSAALVGVNHSTACASCLTAQQSTRSTPRSKGCTKFISRFSVSRQRLG
ncbi:MAG: DUF2235 domain-containing protein [Hydrogenophaga sp.]|uniref:DUF2235 domain-containing protein n=1 Tax=Hydrogenophaga sp. TaxID=1904254 RepID=UPI00257F82D8|nr:DUF2235 domain-containing protein [Hydrogenophaga sp.]MBL0943933.1 DUF2235 domain-containing protein [Hydrogenophaga sp.]